MEHTVQDDEDRAIVHVAARELVPHHDHGDTARQADHDDACAVCREVRQCRPREGEHHEWCDYPVQQEREEDVREHAPREEDAREHFVLHLREDRPHHDDEAYRYGCMIHLTVVLVNADS